MLKKIITICLWSLSPGVLVAQTQWELGVGLGTLLSPDYRGSNERRERILPIPYLHYRSNFLRAEDGRLSSRFFKSERWEFELSANASINIDSKKNRLRQGMQELNPSFELGPSLNLNLSGPSHRDGWMLRLPARAVFGFSEDGIETIGWLWHPNFAYVKHDRQTHWRFGYNLGALYGDRHYHDYYYSVAPQYALVQRPAYQADKGYSGLTTQFSLTRKQNNIWYGGFIRYDNLANSVFLSSPLVESRHYVAIGFGISWILARSNTMLD